MDEDDDVVMAMRGGGVQLKEEQRVSVICSSTLTEIILYRLRKLTYVLIIARAP